MSEDLSAFGQHLDDIDDGIDGGNNTAASTSSTVPGVDDFDYGRPDPIANINTTTTAVQFARPPPPPPLTPPTLSTSVFTFEDRRPRYAVSIPPRLDTTSFIHQPNPDYMMTGASSTSVANYRRSSSPKSATASVSTPRRRSYTKTIPVGIPPRGSTSSSQQWGGVGGDSFSPSSYPPTSPQLPPPPPGQPSDDAHASYNDEYYDYEFDTDDQQAQHHQQQGSGVIGGGGSAPGTETGEIDLQGEIISVMDDAGHGWKRHTRVYGGGVCLACVAAGGQGGFYGDKVPMEERR